LILPVADRHVDAANAARDALAAAGFRARVDERSESVGKKIRDAELARAPYMLVLGDKEQEGDTLSVRSHAEGDIGAMSLKEFVDRLGAEVSDA
jgi:threonyl-tRNA synthetase